ncbi:hypothetical protein RRG08_032053 [Elysia crispata]|uniref:Uncharacterized protein n=1 Tax=Elysia crispata TaxID=231223 RepID=A0AAE0ZIL8_9GAST|nr:hypothetical protein RRG08_032053 [Elysia crispata]
MQFMSATPCTVVPHPGQINRLFTTFAKMMFLQLSIVVAFLAFSSADLTEDEALMALERYANSVSNNMFYARVMGRPDMKISSNFPLTVQITDALLAETSCTQSKAFSYTSGNDLNSNCPAPANARALMKCSGTVTWQNGSPQMPWGTARCGNP